MAQYYQIVSSVNDIKRICENLNMENLQIVQLPSDELQQFGQQQIILAQDQQVIIHDNQIPQLVYHQQNQISSQTQYIIQEDNISGPDNFGPQQQQLYYAQEVSSDNSQIIQQSQIQQQQNDSGQQHTTIHHIQNAPGNQRQVIQQLQQQQQQQQQQQTSSSTQQVIMQPQQHLVVHSQSPQQTVVLQQMNRSVQQTGQRQMVYNPSTNLIYDEPTNQQLLVQNQQIQQQLQNRPVQSRPVLQQRAVVRQPRPTLQPRLTNPGTQVVQIQHPTPQLQQQQQQPQQQQVGQQRVIITPFSQATQNISHQQSVSQPAPLQPRLVQPVRRQYTPRGSNATTRAPRTPRQRTPAPVHQIQQQIIARYMPPKLNTPRITLAPPTPNASQVGRPRGPRLGNTVQHRFVAPPQNTAVAGLTERKQLPKFATPLQTTSMSQPCTPVNIVRAQLKNNLTAKAQLANSPTTPSTSSQSSQSSSDFDADDLENSITAAVVSKNPTTPSNESFNSSQSSISSQESTISQQMSCEEPKKLPTATTTPVRKTLTAEEYRRINQQSPALKFANHRNVSNSSINRQKQIQQQHQIHASKLRTDLGQNSQIDETRNSAKMLVILENGEQRLITFTLPKESCTVQELLEQVGVQFSHETNIQCVSNPGANIDYVVTVGVNQDTNPTDIVAVDTSIQNTQLQQQPQQQSTQSIQQCFNQQPPQLQQQSQPPPLTQTTTPQSTLVVEQQPKPKSPEPPKEPPSKFIEGYYAVCSACGYSGFDHAKCQRCRRIFTEEPKRQPAKPQQSGGNIQQGSSSTATSSAVIPIRPSVTTIGPQLSMDKDKKEINKKINDIVSKSLRGRGGTRGRGRGRGRAVEAEPVILTLSSDEEGESQSSPAQRVPAIPSPINCQPMPFEPVITESNELPQDFIRENIADVKNSDDKQIYTSVQCRSIRIGSYRYDSTEKTIFASKGIRIIAPNCKDKNDNVILDISAHEIVKICVHFAKSLSIVFVYVIPSCGAYIRESLDMATSKNEQAPYFNPAETTDIYKKIILQVENISEDSKSVIRSIYLATILEEISKRDATELYNRSNNMDLGHNSCPDNIRQILIYPQGKGGISINTEDYMCLGSDQYLNDIIIDFYLNYLQLAMLTDEQKAKTHVFSSFFYKRLTTTSTRQRATEKDVKLTASQKRHSRVKSWTKNVNIFEKDFIIIPINEQSHWFLAIICFPGLKGTYTMDTNMPIKNTPTPKKKGEKKLSLQIGSTTITPVTKKEVDSIYLGEDSLSERDEAEGDDSDMASDDSEDEFDGKLQAIKQPCILIFDSLAGTSRSRVVATLRDYLTCEYKVKVFENSTHVFNKLNIPGNSVKVPQQTNFTDCGLYLLQYVEHFFKDPIKDYRLPIKQLAEWFESIVVTRKREEISELLKSLIAKYNPEALPLPEVGFPTLNGKLVEQDDSLNEDIGEFEEEDELDNMFEEDEEFLDSSPEKKSTSSQQNGDRKRNLTASSPLSNAESEPKIKKKILE